MKTLDLQPQETRLQPPQAHVLPHQTGAEDEAANEAVQLYWQRINKRGRKNSSTRRIQPNQTRSTFNVARRGCLKAKKAKCNQSDLLEVQMQVGEVASALLLEAAKLLRQRLQWELLEAGGVGSRRLFRAEGVPTRYSAAL